MNADRQAWAATHVGSVRTLNEDRCLVGVWRSTGTSASWRGTLPESGAWVAVADGMGGHEAGEYASEMTLRTIEEMIGRAETELDIARMLEVANQRLFEAMYGGCGRPAMGTTIVGVRLARATALVFNIGDSRAYMLRESLLVQLSRDHTLASPNSDRRARSHALTQSLGGTISRRPLEPHIQRIDMAEDAKILLCSDGLTDMLSDDEIAGILIRHPDNPCEKLVSAALDAGGNDNITVVVIGTSKSRGKPF